MAPTSNHFKNKNKLDAEIFKLLAQCMDKFGAENFKENLKSQLSRHHFSKGKTHEIKEHIIKSVLIEYKEHGITREDLEKTAKRGYVSEARKICIILIKKNIKISGGTLIKYFGKRSEQMVYKTIHEHSKIDRTSKVKAIQDFIKKYDAVEERVNKFIFEMKKENTQVEASTEN